MVARLLLRAGPNTWREGSSSTGGQVRFAFIVFIGVWSVVGLIRVGLRPKNYVQPGKLPIVAFWNLFDEKRFTAEAIAYHRRMLRFMGESLIALVIGAFLMSVLFPGSVS
jgi:hypothetical protein